jgi:hypothetical protein
MEPCLSGELFKLMAGVNLVHVGLEEAERSSRRARSRGQLGKPQGG